MDHILKLQVAGRTELEKWRKEEEERLTAILKDYADSIYIELSNIDAGNTLAYHLGDEFGTVEPSVHIGTFQDSVLYMQYWGNGRTALDFRYFPGWNSVETYSWSDNIRHAVIKNDSEEVLSFNGTSIQPGETMVFTPEGHRQGLLSPDCYNGKSIFASMSDNKSDT